MVDMTTCNFPITQQTLGVSIELLSRAHVVHGAGNLLAAVFLGVVCTYSSHDLFSWIIAGLLTLSMALVALPWCASLETVYSAYGVVGIGEMLVLAGSYPSISYIYTSMKYIRAVFFSLLKTILCNLWKFAHYFAFNKVKSPVIRGIILPHCDLMHEPNRREKIQIRKMFLRTNHTS